MRPRDRIQLLAPDLGRMPGGLLRSAQWDWMCAVGHAEHSGPRSKSGSEGAQDSGSLATLLSPNHMCRERAFLRRVPPSVQATLHSNPTPCHD